MEIREQIKINAPLRVVWRLFSHMEDWDGWNTTCRNCCITSGDERLAPGTCLSFIIRPLVFPVKLQPRIISCDPGRLVIWEGQKLGIRATHAWQFKEAGGSVRLLSVEHFSGPMAWVVSLSGVSKRIRELTRAFLQTLKKTAEECHS